MLQNLILPNHTLLKPAQQSKGNKGAKGAEKRQNKNRIINQGRPPPIEELKHSTPLPCGGAGGRVRQNFETTMAIKLKAREQKQYVGKYAGQYRYVMSTELYNKLTERKVLAEAAMRSGISQGTINAAWAAIGEVIKAWATEGHSVAVPGLGTMRFGVRATSVADVADVSSSLITCRRVIFTPSTDIKDELANTAINITCYDRDGNIIKQVASDDEGNVEDPESGGGTSGGDDGNNPL